MAKTLIFIGQARPIVTKTNVILSELIHCDHYLFELINTHCQSGFLDWLMPWWRNKLFWIPLYVFIASFLWLNVGRRGVGIVVFALITIGVADLSSSKGIKPLVQRVRPCQSERMNPPVRVLVSCGSGYSFPSSHATNHFALAVFLTWLIPATYRWCRWLLLFWAASISFGQVYVGVHYPIDILAGALLGSIIGTSVALVYLQFLGGQTKKSSEIS
ncbi:MAG: phosphatase PAP2 family protein [Bacteroidota bacterium]